MSYYTGYCWNALHRTSLTCNETDSGSVLQFVPIGAIGSPSPNFYPNLNNESKRSNTLKSFVAPPAIHPGWVTIFS